jgi:hypothetical protein
MRAQRLLVDTPGELLNGSGQLLEHRASAVIAVFPERR